MKTFNQLSRLTCLKIISVFFGATILVMHPVHGQFVASGFNAGKGNLNIAFSYTYEKFEEFYRGSEKVVLGLQDVTNKSYGLYAEYGISDRFDIMVNLPHVTSESSRPGMESMNGFQDLSLQMKYSLIKPSSKPFLATVSAGVIFPASGYDPLIPITIGSHAFCQQVSLTGLYKFGNGFFGEAGTSFIHKNEDAPNALLGSIKLGWASSKVYSHILYGRQTSYNGTDLGDPGSNFQQMNVNYDKLGAYVSYRIVSNLSVSLGGGIVLGGTNIGQARAISLGLVSNL